jgi:hypothetical protein
MFCGKIHIIEGDPSLSASSPRHRVTTRHLFECRGDIVFLMDD